MDMVDLADLITYHKGIDTDILIVHSLFASTGFSILEYVTTVSKLDC